MNEFQRFQAGMKVVPVSTRAVGLKGMIISAGNMLTIERVFEHDGVPHLNFSKIYDAFPAWQFEEYASTAVPA